MKETFTLGQVLTVTTTRLVCDIDDLYKILSHITGDSIYTHQIPRALRFAGPLLIAAHPELAVASACLASLDRWVAADKTEKKTECAMMWLTELRMMFPNIQREYEIESREDAWLSLDPIKELIGMVGENKVMTVPQP